METTNQNELFPTPAETQAHSGVERNCEWCDKPFVSAKPDAKFCSASCKNSASRKRVRERQRSTLGVEKQMFTPTVIDAPLAATLDVPPHAKFIIAQQEKELKRWEENYKKELEKRESAEAKVLDLKEQIKDMQHKQALAGIEEAKPDFLEKLSGFVPESIRERFLGAIADKLLAPGPMAGAGQLDNEAQQQLSQITNWFTAIPKEAQTMVYVILDAFAQNQDAAALIETLKHVHNLLNHGTTIPNGNNINYGT